MTVRTLLQMIGAFFRALFHKFTGSTEQPRTLANEASQQKTTPPHTEDPKPRFSAKAKRRAQLHLLLGRTDGGGKHYGSKRIESNHRGSGRGKRSGHQ